jgi:hypothetical protein
LPLRWAIAEGDATLLGRQMPVAASQHFAAAGRIALIYVDCAIATRHGSTRASLAYLRVVTVTKMMKITPTECIDDSLPRHQR